MRSDIVNGSVRLRHLKLRDRSLDPSTSTQSVTSPVHIVLIRLVTSSSRQSGAAQYKLHNELPGSPELRQRQNLGHYFSENPLGRVSSFNRDGNRDAVVMLLKSCADYLPSRLATTIRPSSEGHNRCSFTQIPDA
ncbi:unnamed protein product [Calypogeia fissa]